MNVKRNSIQTNAVGGRITNIVFISSRSTEVKSRNHPQISDKCHPMAWEKNIDLPVLTYFGGDGSHEGTGDSSECLANQLEKRGQRLHNKPHKKFLKGK